MLQSLNGEGLLNMTPQSETKKKKIDGFDYITIWTLLWQELKKETKSSNKLEKSLCNMYEIIWVCYLANLNNPYKPIKKSKQILEQSNQEYSKEKHINHQ